jgi:hypothetical protein
LSVVCIDKLWDPFLPLAYGWVEPALYESLNAVVFLAMCILVRPTPTSHLLSYSSQLPMEDPDEEDEQYIDEQTHGTIYSSSSSDKRRQQQSLFDYDDQYDDSDNNDGLEARRSRDGEHGEVEMVSHGTK